MLNWEDKAQGDSSHSSLSTATEWIYSGQFEKTISYNHLSVQEEALVYFV